MNCSRVLRRLLPLLAGATLLASAVSADPAYQVTDIGALAHGVHSVYALGVNDNGDVVGFSDVSPYSQNAFLYTATGALTDLGALPGGFYSEALAVNNSGESAGDATTADGQEHAVFWDSRHTLHDMGVPPGYVNSYATAISASGVVAGYATKADSTATAFYYDTAFHLLHLPSAYTSAQATGINAAGVVCGFLTDASDNYTPFYDDGVMHVIPLPQGFGLASVNNLSNTPVVGIDDQGHVASCFVDSQSNFRAFIYDKTGGFQDINPPGDTYNTVYAVSAGGLILCYAGVYSIAGQSYSQAFYGLPGQNSDYATLTGINDSGAVIGQFSVFKSNPIQQYDLSFVGLTDVPPLPGGNDSIGWGLSPSGQVVGQARESGNRHNAVLYSNGALQDLGTLNGYPDYSNSAAFAANASGHIVGYSDSVYGGDHAFLDRYGDMVDIGTLPRGDTSLALAVNETTQITGYSDGSSAAGNYFSQHGFFYSNGVMQDIGALPGGINSYGASINKQGQICGGADTTSGLYHAITWDAAHGMTDLGRLPGGAYSFAYGINDHSQATGDSNTPDGSFHATLWDAKGIHDLGTLPGGTYSESNGINNSGEVVGFADDADGEQRAFVWDRVHGMRDLNALLPAGSGWVLMFASAVNDRGQITGYGTHTINGVSETHGFLLTDTAPPVTTAALNPPTPSGAGGYYTAPVTVTLAATDGADGADAGSGIAETLYSLDFGPTKIYTAPLTVSADRKHYVTFHSVDNRGNVEAARTLALKVDRTAPVTRADAQRRTAGEKIALFATDNFSGVAATVYRLDGGTAQAYTGPFTVTGKGKHTVSYHSADKAGNVEATKTVRFTNP